MALTNDKEIQNFKIPQFFHQINFCAVHFLDIIFENEDFVAVNKPAGLLSIPASDGKDLSLKDLLKTKYDSIFTVHRLDYETSGAIIFAKNETSHKFLSQEFENRTVIKKYLGIVHGTLLQKKGTVDVALAKPFFQKEYNGNR